MTSPFSQKKKESDVSNTKKNLFLELFLFEIVLFHLMNLLRSKNNMHRSNIHKQIV